MHDLSDCATRITREPYFNHIYSNNQNGIHFYVEADTSSYIQNNTICSNTIDQHSGDGIYFAAVKPASDWQSSNLYNNTITSNIVGINFSNSNSVNISISDIANNTDGIYLENSINNTIYYNQILNNYRIGINLTSASTNNNISNNTIKGCNYAGILITNSSNSNLVKYNCISSNGIGTNITDATDNNIDHNNIINNTQNAFDSTNKLNDWDDGAEGNYWSDYTGWDFVGPDGNPPPDGIGDVPYVIPGGGSRDWHPFMNPIVPVENEPPIADFSYSPESPVVAQTITFNASNSTDPDGTIENYEWDFGDGNNTNTTEPITTYSYASAGTYNVNLTVTDDEGATNSTSKLIPISIPLKGDLDGDNQITSTDAAIALDFAVRGEYDPAADVSGNGRVTSLDALIILQMAAGGKG